MLNILCAVHAAAPPPPPPSPGFGPGPKNPDPPGTIPLPARGPGAPYQPYYGPGQSAQAPNAVASLVLSIIGLVGGALGCCPCGVFGLLVSACGWVGFFMARAALGEYPSCQTSRAAMIVGLVAVIISCLVVARTIVSLTVPMVPFLSSGWGWP